MEHFSHLSDFFLFPSRMELKPICIYLASFEWKTREGLAREEWRAHVPGEGLPGDASPCPAHLQCPLHYRRAALAFLICSPPSPPPLPPTNPTQSSMESSLAQPTWKVSGETPGPASGCRPTDAREPEQGPCCRSPLRWGGLTATSFPDTAIPSGCKADVSSPSAARWCKGKSLHGKAPAELTSCLFPAPKSQRSCTPLISVCHN